MPYKSSLFSRFDLDQELKMTGLKMLNDYNNFSIGDYLNDISSFGVLQKSFVVWLYHKMPTFFQSN